jgi:hypothetical protein
MHAAVNQAGHSECFVSGIAIVSRPALDIFASDWAAVKECSHGIILTGLAILDLRQIKIGPIEIRDASRASRRGNLSLLTF